MDNKTRYDLMVKLSDFYIKNVQQNIDGYNKARYIAGTSKLIFWIMFIAVPIVIAIAVYRQDLAVLAGFIMLILCVAVYFSANKLKEMDTKNIIQVIDYSNTEKIVPISADEEIKKHLMVKFLEIFGEFIWYKGYDTEPLKETEVKSINDLIQHIKSTKHWKNTKYIKSLKILNNPFIFCDDCIIGVYNSINMKIFDGTTSIFRIEYIGLIIFLALFVSFLVKSNNDPLIWILLAIIAISCVVFLIQQVTSKSFCGVIVEVDMNKNFEGHTFIIEKNNIKDNATVDKKKYEKIELEDTEFSQEFCVYSENQIEARYILTTAFIERLKNIKKIYKAEYIRAAFKDKKIILLIHTGRDMFQMAGDKPMQKETFVQMFNEFVAVFDLIDILKLNKKLGL